jgi:uncharacterized protein
MSLQTVEAVCRAILQEGLVGETLSVVWHAGEPLVMPIAFYENAMSRMRALLGPAKIRFSLQTNGILLNDDWCRMFKRHDVAIGLSIDGPRYHHDRHRRYRTGAGTFDKALAGAAKLGNHSIPFSVICVLTRDSIGDFVSLFEFFESLAPRDICFNIDEKDGINPSSSFKSEEDLNAFREFYINYFSLARARKSQIRIRELERGLRFILDGRAADYNNETRPLGIITVGHDGAVSTFSPELHALSTQKYGQFIFGNVHLPSSLSQMLQSAIFQEVWADIKAGVKECQRECSYFDVCGGGSPANKLAENSSFASTRTVACAFGVRGLADAVIGHLRSASNSGA